MLKAIREESLLPASSLEAIKGGVVTPTCSDVSCTVNLSDCTVNLCGKNNTWCTTNKCAVNQIGCPCLFVNLRDNCPQNETCGPLQKT